LRVSDDGASDGDLCKKIVSFNAREMRASAAYALLLTSLRRGEVRRLASVSSPASWPTHREKHSALPDHGIVSLGQSGDEAVGVGLNCRLDDPLAPLFGSLGLELGADEPVLNVTSDGGGEEGGLLRDEADLGTKPTEIELLEFDAVEFDRAANGVAKVENEGSTIPCKL
jgi:hypothetical protein